MSGGWGEQERQGGRLGAIGLGVDSRQDDQGAVQPGPEVACRRFDHDRRIGSEGRSTPFTDEARALGIDVNEPDTLAWMGEHLPEWRQQASGQRPLYWILGIGFVVGLAAHVGGFLLKTSVTTEPLLLVADLLYALGWSLWTGVVWCSSSRSGRRPNGASSSGRSMPTRRRCARRPELEATRRRGTTERRRRGSAAATD
jgi:hypothetical protein